MQVNDSISAPERPPSSSVTHSVWGLTTEPGIHKLTYHPLRQSRKKTLCGIAPAWSTFMSSTPHPDDVCEACRRVQQLLSLAERGQITDVAEWATATTPYAPNRDVLPWLRQVREAREARYRLRPGGVPWWRRAIQWIGRIGR